MAFAETLGGTVRRAGILIAISAAGAWAAGQWQAAVGLVAGYAITSLNLWLMAHSLSRTLRRHMAGTPGRFTVVQYLVRYLLFTGGLVLLASWSGAALLGAFGGVMAVKVLLYLEGIRGHRTEHKRDKPGAARQKGDRT